MITIGCDDQSKGLCLERYQYFNLHRDLPEGWCGIEVEGKLMTFCPQHAPALEDAKRWFEQQQPRG